MITPIFNWSQKKDSLFISIDVADIEGATLMMGDSSITVNYDEGKTEVLELFAEIDLAQSRYTKARGFSVHLVKKVAERWPTLVKDTKKHSNVKVDWSRWVDSDDEEAGVGGGFGMGNFDFDSFARMAQNDMGGNGMADMLGGAMPQHDEDAHSSEDEHSAEDNCCRGQKACAH